MPPGHAVGSEVPEGQKNLTNNKSHIQHSGWAATHSPWRTRARTLGGALALLRAVRPEQQGVRSCRRTRQPHPASHGSHAEAPSWSFHELQKQQAGCCTLQTRIKANPGAQRDVYDSPVPSGQPEPCRANRYETQIGMKPGVYNRARLWPVPICGLTVKSSRAWSVT